MTSELFGQAADAAQEKLSETQQKFKDGATGAVVDAVVQAPAAEKRLGIMDKIVDALVNFFADKSGIEIEPGADPIEAIVTALADKFGFDMSDEFNAAGNPIMVAQNEATPQQQPPTPMA